MHNCNSGIYKNGGDGIGSYFLALLTTSVCGALCSLLAWGGFEKYIKYIASLVCILLLISPFKSIDLSVLGENAEFEYSASTEPPDLYSLSAEMTEERAESYLAQIVFSEFGINAVYTDIVIDWSEKEPTLKEITVALEDNDMHLAETARLYLESILGSGVRVIEDRGNA